LRLTVYGVILGRVVWCLFLNVMDRRRTREPMKKERGEEMAKTAKELFNESAVAMLENKKDKLQGINAVFKFDIAGEGGGQWTMDLKNEPFSIKEGDGEKPDCTVTVSHDNFQKLLDNFGIAMQLFTTGKLKVDNPLAAMKLQKVLPLMKK